MAPQPALTAPSGMTIAEARALIGQIKTDHPAWPIGLWLPDATGGFAVMAWTPVPHLYMSAEEYRPTQPGGAA